ncbi:hypothetical protein PGTUg99_004228 [Puccinia graminis f. sp. tritici]|uniref:Uncharacterized protein n=1 Tax=Puccinia graminis f. sp. tritici TaxID=56615 RepID=A0A5B0RU54_PUCGR|nr:hypothetical protein PGTUg99_004228 [Puccinia graminis f. sp. tritici]
MDLMAVSIKQYISLRAKPDTTVKEDTKGNPQESRGNEAPDSREADRAFDLILSDWMHLRRAGRSKNELNR